MSQASQPRRRSLDQAGFSLVELMIAVTLGLMIMTGLVSVFVKNSLARSEIERSNRQIESGRYAISVLRDDLRMAGFLSSFNPYETIILPNSPPLGPDTSVTPNIAAMTTLPDPCDPSVANLNNSYFFPVQGYDSPVTPSTACAPFLTDLRAGSDVLVIRRVSTCVAGPTPAAGCDPVLAGAPYFQASNCYQSTELAKNSGGATAINDYKAYFVLDTNLGSMTKHALDCATIADYRRFLTHIYFVANNDVAGDNIPTLKRLELGAAGFSVVPLVEGIETIQFEYGVDANGDGVIDAYTADPSSYNACVGATCLANWLQTYSVKVNVLARNIEKSPGWSDNKVYTLGLKANGAPNVFPTTGTYGDMYRRHAYNAAVRLENPSGRRIP